MHLICNNHNEDYTCANSKISFELESDDFLQARLQSALDNIHSLEDNFKSQSNKNEELSQEVNKLKEELKVQNVESLKKVNDLTYEKDEILKKFDAVESDKINTLKAKLKTQSKDNEKLSEEIKIMEGRCDELKAQNDKSQQMISDLMDEKAENMRKVLNIETENRVLKEKLDLAMKGVFCPCKERSEDDYVECSNRQVFFQQ